MSDLQEFNLEQDVFAVQEVMEDVQGEIYELRKKSKVWKSTLLTFSWMFCGFMALCMLALTLYTIYRTGLGDLSVLRIAQGVGLIVVFAVFLSLALGLYSYSFEEDVEIQSRRELLGALRQIQLQKYAEKLILDKQLSKTSVGDLEDE